MARRRPGTFIRLRGVRQNNLKNFDLDLPTRRLIVTTGLSGSGKSSLAFDTLFAEGQRRYIETFSPYARQFFDRMDKPQVDRVEGIPPAIAIEQRNTVKTTRSTVGTVTELCDFFKVLWPQVASLHCRQCGQPVRKEPPQVIWEAVRARAAAHGSPGDLLVSFEVSLSDKLPLAESLQLIARQGYQRLLLNGALVRVDEALPLLERPRTRSVVVVQDRLAIREAHRARFVEACEQAYHFGKGKLSVHLVADPPWNVLWTAPFSRGFHCAACDLEYRPPTPALFSFNHPIGACPACKGFGRIITIDYRLAIPDPRRSLAQGAVKPWQTGHGLECQQDLLRMCRRLGAPENVPFQELPEKWKRWVIEGDPAYGTDSAHEWPRAWYGIKGYFRWLESRSYKMHVRVLLSRYRAYSPCPECRGQRFQPETLLYKIIRQNGPSLTLAQLYDMPISHVLEFAQQLVGQHPKRSDPTGLLAAEIRTRLAYLVEVGVGYLTLNRPTRTLSGGETERVNLTSCLGTRLVNTLYILDEPSVGLHARDTGRLVRLVQRLRDAGNTVVVVEHEPAVIQAADHVVDLGPGQGEQGGEVVFNGPYRELLACGRSLTGQYLSGVKVMPPPPRRDMLSCQWLKLLKANRHNLKQLDLRIPLQRLVSITGVSGSGKTTLVREVLWPLLKAQFDRASLPEVAHHPCQVSPATEHQSSEPEPEETANDAPVVGQLKGSEQLGRVVLVDQSPLGKTPRSNPAVYIGAFDHIRELYSRTELARQRGLTASSFSFNSAQGQCEHCRGAGFEKIEMQFLSDVFIRCPECEGRRYRQHILDVKLPLGHSSRPENGDPGSGWSIADLLAATVNEVISSLERYSDSPPALKAIRSLRLLHQVGLGYLRMGQPINTLSGGESQRLKLVSHLAEFAKQETGRPKPTLFLFDEPTTGLHFEDVRVLLDVFHQLVEAGHSVIVVEHNLDMIQASDWVLDLGPEGGDAGGELVVAGTPEEVMRCPESHTGQALREYRRGRIQPRRAGSKAT